MILFSLYLFAKFFEFQIYWAAFRPSYNKSIKKHIYLTRCRTLLVGKGEGKLRIDNVMLCSCVELHFVSCSSFRRKYMWLRRRTAKVTSNLGFDSLHSLSRGVQRKRTKRNSLAFNTSSRTWQQKTKLVTFCSPVSQLDKFVLSPCKKIAQPTPTSLASGRTSFVYFVTKTNLATKYQNISQDKLNCAEYITRKRLE